jgi:type I restriction-modification system DNA methylase subunit
MARTRSTKSSNTSSANIGFEQKIWLAADKLRSNMDAVEYKHVVLRLIFLKYISDSFEEHHAAGADQNALKRSDLDDFVACLPWRDELRLVHDERLDRAMPYTSRLRSESLSP